MAPKRSQRMQILLTLAKRSEDDAAKKLAQMQNQIQQADEQLTQIEDYNQAYKLEIQSKTTGLSGRDMMSDRSFLERLGSAVKEQQERLRQMREHLNNLRQAWQIKHHYSQSIKDLIERIQHAENAALEKKLQSQLDEMATQLYVRNGKGLAAGEHG